ASDTIETLIELRTPAGVAAPLRSLVDARISAPTGVSVPASRFVVDRTSAPVGVRLPASDTIDPVTVERAAFGVSAPASRVTVVRTSVAAGVRPALTTVVVIRTSPPAGVIPPASVTWYVVAPGAKVIRAGRRRQAPSGTGSARVGLPAIVPLLP